MKKEKIYKMKKYKTILFVTFLYFISGCELIAPPGEIPSYIAADSIKVETDKSIQGTNSHNITDSWIYVNGKLIGVFEVPYQIPVLESGKQTIRIEPGIKSGGSSSKREVYSVMNSYIIDSILTKGEVLKIQPKHTYATSTFAYMEDFETGHSLIVSNDNYPAIELIKGEDAFEGTSMSVTIDKVNPSFECTTSSTYPLPKDGRDIYLEINFKYNDANNTSFFAFGFFSLENTGEAAKIVYRFNPTQNIWKKVYVNIRDHVMDTKATEFRFYFRAGFLSGYTPNEKVDIFIDNIKIIHR